MHIGMEGLEMWISPAGTGGRRPTDLTHTIEEKEELSDQGIHDAQELNERKA